MGLGDHGLLMAGIAAFYLADSALLLFHDEVVLEARRSGFLVRAGAAMEFRSRHLFLPNPLCPHRPLIRVGWRVDEAAGAAAQPEHWLRFRLAAAALAPWTWLLLGLFFVALPAALWFGTQALLLGCLATIYLAIIMMLGQLWRRRRMLALSNRALAAIAFDVLLCAPFAINLIRKLSLRQLRPSSLRAVASRLSPAERAALRAILRPRIQTSLDFLDADAAAAHALRTYLDHFEDATP
jgi:hypothetical protein